jgi:hypothetical protein
LRLAHAELPQRVGKSTLALDRLCALGAAVRKVRPIVPPALWLAVHTSVPMCLCVGVPIWGAE